MRPTFKNYRTLLKGARDQWIICGTPNCKSLLKFLISPQRTAADMWGSWASRSNYWFWALKWHKWMLRLSSLVPKFARIPYSKISYNRMKKTCVWYKSKSWFHGCQIQIRYLKQQVKKTISLRPSLKTKPSRICCRSHQTGSSSILAWITSGPNVKKISKTTTLTAWKLTLRLRKWTQMWHWIPRLPKTKLNLFKKSFRSMTVRSLVLS